MWVTDAAWIPCTLEATAPIGPLAWEPSCAAGVALKREKDKKKKKIVCRGSNSSSQVRENVHGLVPALKFACG